MLGRRRQDLPLGLHPAAPEAAVERPVDAAPEVLGTVRPDPERHLRREAELLDLPQARRERKARPRGLGRREELARLGFDPRLRPGQKAHDADRDGRGQGEEDEERTDTERPVGRKIQGRRQSRGAGEKIQRQGLPSQGGGREKRDRPRKDERRSGPEQACQEHAQKRPHRHRDLDRRFQVDPLERDEKGKQSQGGRDRPSDSERPPSQPRRRGARSPDLDDAERRDA